jgi:hypothetical protein
MRETKQIEKREGSEVRNREGDLRVFEEEKA